MVNRNNDKNNSDNEPELESVLFSSRKELNMKLKFTFSLH